LIEQRTVVAAGDQGGMAMLGSNRLPVFNVSVAAATGAELH